MTDQPTLTDGTVTLRPRPGETTDRVFDVVAGGRDVGVVGASTDGTTATLTWRLDDDQRGRGYAARAVRVLVDWSLTGADQGGLGVARVEAHVEPGNDRALRVATRSGMLREGVRRRVPGEDGAAEAMVVLARLSTDPPLSDPSAFRALLNSFLPRKRAIGQLLVRDLEDRVLLCQLTYKQDWDLPGGVVEVGESPRLATAREVSEELGLDLPAGDLLLTDWLPPWSGWDDAVCLVFDGGRHDARILDRVVRQEREILSAEFCTHEELTQRCRDFTVRRIAAALDGSTYTESGITP